MTTMVSSEERALLDSACIGSLLCIHEVMLLKGIEYSI
jgi:hypothetical protein